jgi:hypothetical protein
MLLNYASKQSVLKEMNLEFLNINLNYKIEFQEKSLSQYSKTKTSANKTKEHVKLSCFNDSFLASVKPYS